MARRIITAPSGSYIFAPPHPTPKTPELKRSRMISSSPSRPPSRRLERREEELDDREDPFLKHMGHGDIFVLSRIQDNYEMAFAFLAYFFDLGCLPEELKEATGPYLDLIEGLRGAIRLIILKFRESDYAWFMREVPDRRCSGVKDMESKFFWTGAVDIDPDNDVKLDKDNANWFSALFFDLCNVLDRLLLKSEFGLSATKVSRTKAMDELDSGNPDWHCSRQLRSIYKVPHYGPLGRGFGELGASAGWVDNFKTAFEDEAQRKMVDAMWMPFNDNWMKLRTVSRRYWRATPLWTERASSTYCFNIKEEQRQHWAALAMAHPREANPRLELHKVKQERDLSYQLAEEARERTELAQAEEDLEAMSNTARQWSLETIPETPVSVVIDDGTDGDIDDC